MANPRLKDKYFQEIVPALKDRFNYKSIMQVPKLTKVVINKGIGQQWQIKNL
jgi:large subunit ribosomal protein L5